MMRMEEELKHVCRLCKKRYPSGKSLGGHMRSHAIANSNASSSSSSLHKLKLKKKKIALVFAETNGYGLRENPRKTWRMVDTNANQERICKQCGKSFQSLKALCCHMSTHSERDRNFTNSWASDEEDDDEDEGSIGRSVAMVGCSSGVEHEQEELAMCLMMLSRDSGQRAGFNFTTGSSDNSSTNGSVEMKVKYEELDNSESGYFENGAKELESTDDSVHGFNGSELLHDRNVVKIAHHSPTKGPSKAGKYKCSVCLKFFKTHQSLGGHILTHRRDDIKNASYNGENEKRKGHFCPFCPKVFKSGQALGGHKRSHFSGCSSQDIEENNYRRLLDLNLPASVEEDGNGGSDGLIKPW